MQTYLERSVHLDTRHVRARQVEDDLQPEGDDRFGKLERTLGCATARAPCNRYGKGREEWRGREALDAVEEVGDTGRSAGREEFEGVERPLAFGEKRGEMRHVGVLAVPAGDWDDGVMRRSWWSVLSSD